MKELEWAYLAGVVDGEGCIHIKKRLDQKFVGYQTNLTITQKDTSFTLYLKDLIDMKCCLSKPKGNCTVYHLVYSSHQAYELCKGLLPYLVLKKEQAKLLIYFYENLQSYRGKKTNEIGNAKEMAYKLLKALKKTK